MYHVTPNRDEPYGAVDNVRHTIRQHLSNDTLYDIKFTQLCPALTGNYERRVNDVPKD